jgi:hypothetical protein
VKRVGVSLFLLLIPIAIAAIVFGEPRTLPAIAHAFAVFATGPINSAWLRVTSTGPLRRAVLLLLFVALPIVLFPAYLVRGTKRALALTILGALLWLVSVS